MTSNEIVNLKHRLTGAAILVLLGVVILPMILNGHIGSNPGSNPGGDPSFDSRDSVLDDALTGAGDDAQYPGTGAVLGKAVIGSQGQQREFVSYLHPNQAPTTTQSATNPQAVAAASPPTLRLQPLDETQAVGAEDEPSGEAPSSESSNSGDLARGWIVRIGSFAEKANAEKIVALLRSNGIEPQTTDVQTGIGSVTRIWIGPFGEREAAARQRAHIQDATGEKGYIKPYP